MEKPRYGPFILLRLFASCLFHGLKFLLRIKHTSPPRPPLADKGFKFKHYTNDDQKLATLLKEAKNGTVIFASIDVHAWDLDTKKLTDIGVSTWQPDAYGRSDIKSYHWQIRENKSLKNEQTPNYPEIFTFGKTEIVGESHIAAVLDGVFEPLIDQFSRVVVVGHGINTTLTLLKNSWECPGSVIFLDTQKIWQLQHSQSIQVGLEEVLETTPQVRYNKLLLDNAGNDARFTLHLLHA